MSKVKIGQIIYVAYRNSLYKQKVYMVGKESFAHDDTFNTYIYEDFRLELFYEDEGTKWFRTLADAKKKYKIEKIEEGYWGIIK